MKKKVTTGSLDLNAIDRHRKEFEDKESKINKEAKAFLDDKEVLEQHFERINESSLSTEDKRKALEALKELVNLRQKDFEYKIERERELLQTEEQQEIDNMTIGIEEIIEEIDSLEKTELKANSDDATSVIETLEEKKKEFEWEQEFYAKQLNEQIQQAEEQAKVMRKRKF